MEEGKEVSLEAVPEAGHIPLGGCAHTHTSSTKKTQRVSKDHEVWRENGERKSHRCGGEGVGSGFAKNIVFLHELLK